MVKEFDLNIEKVLENWDVADGIREVIANALDEQLLTNTEEIKIFQDKEGWHIRDFGRGLNYTHLTQKENNEKLSHPEKVIGKFGVGLKDAFATFDRHKIKILTKSKYGQITLKMQKKHGFEKLKTLHAEISEPTEPDFIGTDFILNGCSEKEIENAKSNFLKFSNDKLLEKTRFGDVYLKEKGISKIYITGMKVATEENFLFSYNVTSMTVKLRKALNRERSNVGRTAYSDRVKQILLECKSEEVADELVKDLTNVDKGTSHDEIGWLDVATHACKLLNAKRKVVFATSYDLIENKQNIDDAIKDGYEIINVPINIQLKISQEKDYEGNPIRTVKEYINEFNESFEFEFIKPENLTEKEKETFSKIKEILNLIGGKPKNVKEILISETMRKNEVGQETEGLWESTNSRIIIKRSQLKSLNKFTGTLLHELAHATSGCSDVSREFENELTTFLGLVGSKALD